MQKANKEEREKKGKGREGGREKKKNFKKDHINERRGILVVKDINIILRDQPISFSFSNFYFLPLKYFFFYRVGLTRDVSTKPKLVEQGIIKIEIFSRVGR